MVSNFNNDKTSFMVQFQSIFNFEEDRNNRALDVMEDPLAVSQTEGLNVCFANNFMHPLSFSVQVHLYVAAVRTGGTGDI